MPPTELPIWAEDLSDETPQRSTKQMTIERGFFTKRSFLIWGRQAGGKCRGLGDLSIGRIFLERQRDLDRGSSRRDFNDLPQLTEEDYRAGR
jgi:hypothetical protein